MKLLFLIAISITTVGFADVVLAESDDKQRRHGPPQVAFDACAALVEGDPCGFEGRRGQSVEGTCFTPPDQALVCRPSEPPRRFRHREEREEVDVAESDDAS